MAAARRSRLRRIIEFARRPFRSSASSPVTRVPGLDPGIDPRVHLPHPKPEPNGRKIAIRPRDGADDAGADGRRHGFGRGHAPRLRPVKGKSVEPIDFFGPIDQSPALNMPHCTASSCAGLTRAGRDGVIERPQRSRHPRNGTLRTVLSRRLGLTAAGHRPHTGSRAPLRHSRERPLLLPQDPKLKSHVPRTERSNPAAHRDRGLHRCRCGG
jgi:hypothetical protein